MLPGEEPIWIVPLLGYVQIEPMQPPLLMFRLDRRAEVIQQRRGTCHTHVCHQASEQARRAAECALEVHLALDVPFVLELPGHDLAEGHIGIRQMGKRAVPQYCYL